jgi:hypothetical protein
MGTPSLGDSRWRQAMGMHPGDVLIRETEESNGAIVATATRIERNGVVIKRTVEKPGQPA